MENPHHEIGILTEAIRIPGMSVSEVLYTDDTVLLAPDTPTFQKQLSAIESISEKYGLSLKYNKCELFVHSCKPRPKFKNGTPIPKTTEVTYLGVKLNTATNAKQEVEARIRT